MSEPAVAKPKSFLAHAKIIGALTLVSRLLGLARDVIAGHFLGTGVAASAFSFAFTIPNLFRRLLGEGALSAAFIPLYAQAEKRGSAEAGETPMEFASGAFNLLLLLLIGITLIGEAIIGSLLFVERGGDRLDRLLVLQFVAIMLPYVIFICGGAFLSAVLQVHRKFAAPAFAPMLLNLCHILVVSIGAMVIGLRANSPAAEVLQLQTRLAIAMSFTVLLAGLLQVAVLLPALKQIGFAFRPTAHAWTASTKKMLRLAMPIALGAGVLQLSVLLDEFIGYALMQGQEKDGRIVQSFSLLGRVIRYPLELGAPTRLDRAQQLYQFSLGVFAIALATAIFPTLSADALEKGRENFKRILRQGIEATLWEGFPASVGLILIREPLTRLLFQHGQTTAHDCTLIARSTLWFATAIWAFSLLQVINRAYYAIHDSITPLCAAVGNIIVNLIVELLLLWQLGEAGMAAGTAASFILQAVIMLWMLDRKLGGIGLREIGLAGGKMLIASGAMWTACVLAWRVLPNSETRFDWSIQISVQVLVAAIVYLAACALLRVNLLNELLPARFRRRDPVPSPSRRR